MNEMDPLLPLQMGNLTLILDIVLVFSILILTISVVYGVFLLRQFVKENRRK